MGRENKNGEPATDSQEDLLARWSRRKLDARHEIPVAPGDEAAAVAPPGPLPAEPENELTDADMPSIETLDERSDFSPFLSPGVSDGLRRMALRKLFSQPAYNVTDGLNDYDEDFTQFAGLGNLVTHEMKRLLQRELEAEKNLADSTDKQTSPANEVTAAAETDDAANVDITLQNNDPGEEDVPSG